MRMERIVDLLGTFKIRLRDCYSTAVSCCVTSEKLNTMELDVLSHLPKAFPHWARQNLDGYRDALRENHWRTAVIWQHFIRDSSGNLVPTTFDEQWAKGEHEAIMKMESGHVYKSDVFKPFTPIEPIDKTAKTPA